MPVVVITGAAGLIGGILRSGLSDRYELRLLDARARRGSGVKRVDTTRLGRMVDSFRGADAVIDLAADAAADAPWQRILENNVPAVVNALEASRSAGVKRFVYASSNHVTGGYEQDEPYASILAGRYGGLDSAATKRISPADPIRPDGPYAVGKAMGEAAARLYADRHGLSAVCLRIGSVLSADRPSSPRHFSTFLSSADLVRLVDCALQAPLTSGYEVVYGVSDNRWRIWDLDGARSSLGYRPRDDAERYR